MVSTLGWVIRHEKGQFHLCNGSPEAQRLYWLHRTKGLNKLRSQRWCNKTSLYIVRTFSTLCKSSGIHSSHHPLATTRMPTGICFFWNVKFVGSASAKCILAGNDTGRLCMGWVLECYHSLMRLGINGWTELCSYSARQKCLTSCYGASVYHVPVTKIQIMFGQWW